MQASTQVAEAYEEFLGYSKQIVGIAVNRSPTHSESCEVMQRLCTDRGWWDWRGTRAGRDEFPSVPITWVSHPGAVAHELDAFAEPADGE
jgi:hypothetical protein